MSKIAIPTIPIMTMMIMTVALIPEKCLYICWLSNKII